MIVVTRTGLHPHRRGVALMLVALLLPSFLGLFALTIDAGGALERHRMLQATADAVAVAVVNRMDHGYTPAQTLAHANAIRAFNYSASGSLGWNAGLADSINNPPRTGPRTGNPAFYEVFVSAPVSGLFSSVLGWAGLPRITARAVSGLADDDAVESIIGMDPCADPGIQLGGNATLRIDGAILTNSGRGGIDQYGSSVNLGLTGYGVDLGSNNTVEVRTLSVRGGVNPASFPYIRNFAAGGPSPLRANLRRVLPDPMATLPIPNAGNTAFAGATAIAAGDWSLTGNRKPSVSVTNGNDITINPGIYSDINVNPGGRLTLRSGVYIISPNSNNQGFRISGSVTGTNVMIYLTGDNFTTASAGDVADGPVNSTVVNPTDTSCGRILGTTNEGNIRYASLELTSNGAGNDINLTGVTDPNSPFANVVFFVRRRITNSLTISPGSGAGCTLNGIVYAKWAPLLIGGNGYTRITYPLAVARFQLSGGGVLDISTTNVNWQTSLLPYLVE